jgi:ABC-type glycerol-3-phosphate transport system permease component
MEIEQMRESSNRAQQPLTVGIANLQPPLVLFVVLNRFYVRGLFAGSVE